MPLPGQGQNPTQTAQGAPANPNMPREKSGVTLNTQDNFELPPAGLNPAVLAEITFFEVEEEKKDKDNRPTGQKHMVTKIMMSFELEAIYQKDGPFKGKRCIIKQDYYTSFKKGTKLYKVALKWANKSSFTKEEAAQWQSYIEEKKLIGANCVLNVIHHTSKANRTSAWIGSNGEDVMAPPATQNLTVSPDYTPYFQRLEQGQRMREENAARQQQSGGQQQSRQKDEFNGQF